LPKRLVGFIQRLLPSEAEIPEQMRIVGELAQRLALPAPRRLSAQRVPSGRKQLPKLID
jgi:hypothetical protein